MATYGRGIDQSHAKSVSHILRYNIHIHYDIIKYGSITNYE